MTLPPSTLTLRDLQHYVGRIERERGFADETALEKCLLLGEEVGELFKAVRKKVGIKTDPRWIESAVEDELADVLMFVLKIANRFDIDLERAVRDKEAKDAGREWRSSRG